MLNLEQKLLPMKSEREDTELKPSSHFRLHLLHTQRQRKPGQV